MNQLQQVDSPDTRILQLFAGMDEQHFMDEQDKTAEDYDRWMNKDSFIGKWMRYWLSPSNKG